MPKNGDLDRLRDYVRVLVPVALIAVGAYLSATGSTNFDTFQDYALAVLITYFGVDGVLRATNKAV